MGWNEFTWDELWDGWKLNHINTMGHIGEMNYMGWTLRMDERWPISTIGQMCEMNYMDELWDGWKLDHINTMGHIGEMNYMGWTLKMDENWPH